MPSVVISTSTSGDNAIVAASTTGYAIRVLGYVITFSAAVNVQWFSDVGGSAVALTGLLYGIGTAPTAIVVVASDFGARGVFQTAKNVALNLKLSGSVAVGGHVTYEMASQ